MQAARQAQAPRALGGGPEAGRTAAVGHLSDWGGALHTVSPLETKLEHVFPKTGWDFYIPLCPSPTHLCPTFPM